ncbi:MAG TPA: CHAD domain-containing protein [Oscillatoriales cyanobacterium M59_W2019_021]|nr:CHAD domain-containing protein [Oscillatoriales cyanobacterium M59_W2019_021]
MTDFQTQDSARTFGDWAAIAIAKHARKIFKYESDVLKDKDPEDLHQMRVGMRRLRTAVVSFDRAIELPSEVAEKKIGKLARILGSLRDLDVLQEAIETQYIPSVSPDEQKELKRAIKALKKRRKIAIDRVRETLKGDRYHSFKEALQLWLEDPKFKAIADVAIETVLPDVLLPEIANFLLHPGWWIGVSLNEGTVRFHELLSPEAVRDLLDRQGEILHDLRKEAKRTRYQMELFPQFYNETYSDFVRYIKQTQEVLGNIQDGFVFAEFLTDVLKVDASETMPELTARIIDLRYQQWQEWESLQRQFLDVQNRQYLRAIVQHPSDK